MKDEVLKVTITVPDDFNVGNFLQNCHDCEYPELGEAFRNVVAWEMDKEPKDLDGFQFGIDDYK